MNGTRHRRWLAGLAALGLTTGLLGACGGSATTGARATKQEPVRTAAQLLGAANKEGTVVWYTTSVSSQITPIISAFNKQYPHIKLQTLRLSADQLPPRVITEQRGAKYNADVISGDAVQLDQLINAGALSSYDAPDQPPLPSGLSLPAGHQGVIYANTTVIAYNPSALKADHLQTPTSWRDLTQPKWKGKFSIDPGAVNWYQSEISVLGNAKALALVKAIGSNNPQIVSSHTQALTQVEQGEPVATATAYGYLASSEAKKDPSELAFVNVVPLPTSLNLVDVAKEAPHPSAAKLFVDWLESQQGQQALVAVTNQTSLRADVQNDSTVWNPTKWVPAWANPETTSTTYNAQVQQYQSALHDS